MNPAIIDIPGIGPAAAATLAEHHIMSLADLAGAAVEKVSAVPGFSEARAAQAIVDAAGLLAASEIAQSAEGEESEGEVKAAGKGKKGKGKKGKKGKKSKGKGRGKGKGKK